MITLTKHAKERLNAEGVSEQRGLDLFKRAKQVELTKRAWASKFMRWGMAQEGIEYYFYNGWVFVVRREGEKQSILTVSYPCKKNLFIDIGDRR